MLMLTLPEAFIVSIFWDVRLLPVPGARPHPTWKQHGWNHASPESPLFGITPFAITLLAKPLDLW